ncbi:MAG: DUF1566 domain-containing protein [Bacteroidales bacterium]|nr:DUF1566 domain-containing protein [Bacteroidales bacterium]
MKKITVFVLIATMLTLIVACVKDLKKEGIYTETEITGIVVEKSTNAPLSDVKVKITDGDHIHATVITGANGAFRLKMNTNEINDTYYLLIDGSPNLPSKQEELRGIGSEIYNYNYIVLYDKTDTNLLPHVTTGNASNIMAHSATVGGGVSFSGGSPLLVRGICYATHQSPTIGDSTSTAGMEVGPFNCNIDNLQADMTYYYRAYATNSVGTSYGEQKTFTTTNGSPSVTTTAPTNILATSAQSGGNVTSEGETPVTARGVCWNTTGNPDTNDTHTTNGIGAGIFTSNMTGLTVGTTYHLRAYATNSYGTSYGNETTFTTLSGSATMSIASATNITASSATCNVTVSSDGGSTITERGICWSTAQSPTVNDQHVSYGSGTGTFTASMNNLTLSTTYYVRAYAVNGFGTSYSNQINFTTSNGLPTVTTTMPTLYDTTVSTGGNVSSDGGFAVTARGICYGPLPYPDLTSTYSHTTNGSGTGYYSSTFSLLGGSGTYYIRAYATNANGTSYGTQVTVTHPYDTLPTFFYNSHTYRVAPDPHTSYTEYISWEAANTYCNNLTAYGYSDWRMPTKEELETMYQNRVAIGGFIDYVAYSNVKYYSFYHSSTGDGHSHYKIDWQTGAALIDIGNVVFDYGHYNTGYYFYYCHVRPIRVEN